eukprot:170090_1
MAIVYDEYNGYLQRNAKHIYNIFNTHHSGNRYAAYTFKEEAMVMEKRTNIGECDSDTLPLPSSHLSQIIYTAHTNMKALITNPQSYKSTVVHLVMLYLLLL